MKVGDIVSRKSYGGDVFFRVIAIRGDKVILRGVTYRIEADAVKDDLTVLDMQQVEKYEREIEQRVQQILGRVQKDESGSGFRAVKSSSSYKRMATVLHLDGDQNYLQKCVDQYSKLEIPVVGRYIEESMQPRSIRSLLENHRPDIVVITGHDAVVKGTKNMQDLRSYKNSNYFVESVKEARRYEPNYDNLIIFAGACQSYYEAIMEAGANYASSPDRIFIQALDPVFVVHKLATSSIREIVDVPEVIRQTITGLPGIGGLQTRGKYREGMPPLNKEFSKK